MKKSHTFKNKGPETHDRYWWWMVHGKSAKRLTPLRRTNLSKKSKERQDEIQKKLYEAKK